MRPLAIGFLDTRLMPSSITVVETERDPGYAPHLARLRAGVWRDRILHDLILEDASTLSRPLYFSRYRLRKGVRR
jgi:hypothetical protein